MVVEEASMASCGSHEVRPFSLQYTTDHAVEQCPVASQSCSLNTCLSSDEFGKYHQNSSSNRPPPEYVIATRL